MTKPKNLQWKIHTPNLLNEVLCNAGTGVLNKPIQLLGIGLHAVATRAAELNDPALNLLMLDLTLYELGDPTKHTSAEINRARAGQVRRLRSHRRA